MAAIHPVERQFVGDTLRPMNLILDYQIGGSTKSLLGANVIMEIVRGKAGKVYLTLTSDQGDINILDPDTGAVTILPKNSPGLPRGEYLYHIYVRYADNTVKTFIGGDFPIVDAIEGHKLPQL